MNESQRGPLAGLLIRIEEIACGCCIATEWETGELVTVRCQAHVRHEGQPARLYRALALMQAEREER